MLDLLKYIRKRVQESSKPPLAPGDYFYPTKLRHLCRRREVLCRLHGVDETSRFAAAQLFKFDMGHGQAGALTDNLLPDIGLIRGKWVCHKCGSFAGGSSGVFDPTAQVARPDSCPNCGARGSRYMHFVETWNACEVHKMAGLCDGFLHNPEDGSLGVLEIKTKNSFQFDQLTTPDDDYYMQVQWYLAITGLDWGYLLYWRTGGDRYPRDLKGFFIDRNDRYIEGLREWCGKLREELTTLTVPEKKVCGSPSDRTAKYCPVRDICFSDCTNAMAYPLASVAP